MLSQNTADYDVAIVGGSFAGLSAALYLARARRSVVVFDHGRTRNRFSPHGHGFLGMDGLTPDEMRLRGRNDVLAYPTADMRDDAVDAITREGAGYLVVTADGRRVLARRVILATHCQRSTDGRPAGARPPSTALTAMATNWPIGRPAF